jgi:YD repeat-containing protein
MNEKNTPQRKTTLKWNADGELSEIDMLRILEKLSSTDLNQCELTCDYDQV